MDTKIFMFDGYEREFIKDFSTKGNIFWIDETEENLIVTDKHLNIIYTVKADCGQNSGFLRTFHK